MIADWIKEVLITIHPLDPSGIYPGCIGGEHLRFDLCSAFGRSHSLACGNCREILGQCTGRLTERWVEEVVSVHAAFHLAAGYVEVVKLL